MTANAAIFTIVNKFPKNGKIFIIVKILFRPPKAGEEQKSLVEAAVLSIIIFPHSKVKKRSCILLTRLRFASRDLIS